MKKRLVSLLLTLALLVLPVVSAGAAQPDPTLVQTQTETAEAAQHQYSYIALGDSIVAGIGLPDAVYQRNGRYYDVSGNYQGYSKDCYVARVAEGLGLSPGSDRQLRNACPDERRPAGAGTDRLLPECQHQFLSA